MDIYETLFGSQLPGHQRAHNNRHRPRLANAELHPCRGIYVAYQRSCVKLNPATGQKTGEYQLPADPGEKEPPLWGYLSVFENYLVGGANPLFNPGLGSSRGENDNYSSSSKLVVMDRGSGKVLWTAAARSGFRHNAICIGGGRLYGIDRISGPELSRLKRRGEDPPNQPRLVVFDLASGKELWSTEHDVFGTWLSYAAERDVLVEAGRVASDTISDEPKGMRAYGERRRGPVGEQDASGPAMIHHETSDGRQGVRPAYRCAADARAPAERRTGGMDLVAQLRLQYADGLRAPAHVPFGGGRLLRLLQ
jgi:outer membrane protein assembly factor BamB